MKQRILFVTQTQECGGTEKHVVELIRRLDPSVQCAVLCYAEDFYTSYFRELSNVRVVVHPRRTIPERFLAYWSTFLKFRPHVIVLVKGIFDLFPWYTYLAAKLSGAKRVVAIEQLIADPAPEPLMGSSPAHIVRGLVGWRARHLATKWLQGRLSDITICVSEAVRKRLVDEYGYPQHKTITICNGVDLSHFGSDCESPGTNECNAEERTSNGGTIVCVARLSKPKRIDILLDALHLLSKTNQLWTCLLVGGGPLESALRAHAASLGLSETVKFIGHVDDVRPYLRRADLFVLSSEKEGLPHALLEAMTYGLPCIASDVAGNGEVLLHRQNGLLFKSGSVEQLAQALSYLLVHREEGRRMGMRAKHLVYERFDIEKTMSAVKNALLN